MLRRALAFLGVLAGLCGLGGPQGVRGGCLKAEGVDVNGADWQAPTVEATAGGE